MKVVATVGRNGSGKDTVLKYLEDEFGIPVVSTGDSTRQIAKKEGVEATRENLQEIAGRYVDQQGEDFFVARAIQNIKKNQLDMVGVVGISGIRTPADVQRLREEFDDAIIVHVKVDDPRLRFERVQQRNAPRDPEDFEAFQHHDESEEEQFQLSKTAEQADVVIDNNGSREDTWRQVQEKIVEGPLSEELRPG